MYNQNIDNGLHWDASMQEPVGRYVAKTFGWMALGLFITFATAIVFLFTSMWQVLYAVPLMPYILMIAEVLVVMYLSARVHKLSLGTARGLFFFYAILNGLTFSMIFVLYDVFALIFAFGLTSIYFAVMAGYGYITKRDLSGLRPLLIFSTIFLAVFWLLSMFLPFSGMERIMCIIGVVVFMAYTAYDTQKIRQYHAMYANNREMANKASIIGALALYLDFINLFLYILRLVGRAKD